MLILTLGLQIYFLTVVFVGNINFWQNDAKDFYKVYTLTTDPLKVNGTARDYQEMSEEDFLTKHYGKDGFFKENCDKKSSENSTSSFVMMEKQMNLHTIDNWGVTLTFIVFLIILAPTFIGNITLYATMWYYFMHHKRVKSEYKSFWFFMMVISFMQVLILAAVSLSSILHLEVAGDPKQMIIDSLAIVTIIEIDNAVGKLYLLFNVELDPIGIDLIQQEDFYEFNVDLQLKRMVTYVV